VFDLMCLTMAVPGTVLLEVLTGHPTVPETTATAAPGMATSTAEEAGRILLGLATYCISQGGMVLDIFCLDIAANSTGPTNTIDKFFGGLDFAVDFTGWALGAAVSYAWVNWVAQDWFYWVANGLPQLGNFYYLFADGSATDQTDRDSVNGLLLLVVASVYAHFWPDTYLNAPKAKGLTLTANIFTFSSSISEIAMSVGGFEEAVFLYTAAAKASLFTVGNVLTFTANVLGAVDG
jgi:hypothetical protein